MYFSEGRERGKVYVYTLREVRGSTAERAGDTMGRVSPPVTSPLWLRAARTRQLLSNVAGHIWAAWPKGSRAWLASLLSLEENSSVFLVYKQSRGLFTASRVQPELEQSRLSLRLRCSELGKLPSPGDLMHGV